MPEKVSFSSHVAHKFVGMELASYLTTRFTYFNREQWHQIIQASEVLLNGEPSQPQHVLKLGDKVSYLSELRPEPVVPKKIPVLFEDEDLIVVNKPQHLAVHPSGRYLKNTLIHLLKEQRRLSFLVLSHRLDRETSGVCVLCKTQLAKDKMYWQFFDHKVQKTYWALVWGRPQPSSGVIDAPIGDARPHESKIRIKQVVGGNESRTAKTKYHTLSTSWIEAPQWTPPLWPALKGQTHGPWPISLVECQPITGRTNQIRVHMAHLGAGILGDKLYDPDESVFTEIKDQKPTLEGERSAKIEKYFNISSHLKRRLILDAHALHAKELRFRHPRSSKPMVISAPPPASWKGLYKLPGAFDK